MSLIGGLLGGSIVHWVATPQRGEPLRTKTLVIESASGETVATIDGGLAELRISGRSGKGVILMGVNDFPSISLVEKSGKPALWLGLEAATGSPTVTLSDPAFEGYIRLGNLERSTIADFWGIDVRNPSDRKSIGFGVARRGQATFRHYSRTLDCTSCESK
jgi:hypothetical protein